MLNQVILKKNMHRACSLEFISNKSWHKKKIGNSMTLIQKDYIAIKRVFFFFNRINNTQLIKRKFF